MIVRSVRLVLRFVQTLHRLRYLRTDSAYRRYAGSGIIISINNDPDAPINTIADYVINGSIEEVVPKMIKYYKQIASKERWLIIIQTYRNSSFTWTIRWWNVFANSKNAIYRDKDEFDYAPLDFEDAVDSYDKVLEITGEITGEIIAANAEGVDEEGPHCANGRVEYASGTKQNLDAMVKAGLNGMTMPRRFGGLNFPITPYTMCAEIVAAADAGFGNIWSLQDCIETLYEFGNADQHSRFIPRVCQGETMSMDLTEPDAGSDLQAVMLKATYSEKTVAGCWTV